VAVDLEDFVSGLQDAGDRLGRAAASCALDEPVPTCPEWSVRDLVAHICGVHRWATSFVSKGKPEPDPAEEAAYFAPVPDHELLAHYHAGLDNLVTALSDADPGLQCWTFLPAPSPLLFWARRQAHETAIHCADAEAAARWPSQFSSELSLDGIDELLHCFFGRSRGTLVSDPPVTLAVEPTGSRRGWSIRIEPDRRVVTDGVGVADCRVSGPATDLYLLLWNRRALGGPIVVEGDTRVLEHWREGGRIRWS